MHAQFLFLLTADSLQVPDEQLLTDVLGRFYVLYMEDFCGPDNGCCEQIVVCQNGRIINCPYGNYYRGHKQWYQEFISLPLTDRWSQSIRQAYSIAAKSFQKPRPFRSKKEMIYHAKYALKTTVPYLCRSGDGMLRQRARDLGEAVEAVEAIDFAPFSPLLDTPYYNWRLWDLRDAKTPSTLLPEDVILFVNIHL